MMRSGVQQHMLNSLPQLDKLGEQLPVLADANKGFDVAVWEKLEQALNDLLVEKPAPPSKKAMTRAAKQTSSSALTTMVLRETALTTKKKPIQLTIYTAQCLGNSLAEHTLTQAEMLNHRDYALQIPQRLGYDAVDRIIITQRMILKLTDAASFRLWVKQHAKYIRVCGAHEFALKNGRRILSDPAFIAWKWNNADLINKFALTDYDLIKFGPGSPIVIYPLYQLEQRFKDAFARCEEALKTEKFSNALEVNAQHADVWWSERHGDKGNKEDSRLHALENFHVLSSMFEPIETKNDYFTRLNVFLFPHGFGELVNVLFKHSELMGLDRKSFMHIRPRPYKCIYDEALETYLYGIIQSIDRMVRIYKSGDCNELARVLLTLLNVSVVGCAAVTVPEDQQVLDLFDMLMSDEERKKQSHESQREVLVAPPAYMQAIQAAAQPDKLRVLSPTALKTRSPVLEYRALSPSA